MGEKRDSISATSGKAKNQKSNLKPIPSTIRGKKRYVLFALHSESRLRPNDVNESLWKVMLNLFGERGVGEQKLWLVLWGERNGRGIAKCSYQQV